MSYTSHTCQRETWFQSTLYKHVALPVSYTVAYGIPCFTEQAGTFMVCPPFNKKMIKIGGNILHCACASVIADSVAMGYICARIKIHAHAYILWQPPIMKFSFNSSLEMLSSTLIILLVTYGGNCIVQGAIPKPGCSINRGIWTAVSLVLCEGGNTSKFTVVHSKG